MKKPFLSKFIKEVQIFDIFQIKYDQKLQYSILNSKIFNQSTMETINLENINSNEFYLSNSTILTESIENSDPDEFHLLENTKLTYTIENSDPDEFLTLIEKIETRSIETSTPDEFHFTSNIKSTDPN